MRALRLTHLAIFLAFLIEGCQFSGSTLDDIQITQTTVSERATKLAIAQTVYALETLENGLNASSNATSITPTMTIPSQDMPTLTITPSPLCITPYCTAPNFSLRTLEGETISLDGLRGKSVILNFWASWCSPCEEETPLLQGLYDKYKDEGLVVLGINQDESMEEIKKFIEIYDVTFPILLDPGEKISDDLYDVVTIPRTFFIDRNGVIRDMERGLITADVAEAKTKELLADTLWASPTPIPDSTLTIRNNSTTTICYIYVSLSSNSTWGDDKLENRTLEPGENVEIDVSSGLYDIQLEDCDGNELRTVYEVYITGDHLIEHSDE